MSKFDTVVIQNCIERKKEGEVMKKLLERKADGKKVVIAMDEQMKGAWESFRKAIRVPTDKEYIMLIQDDLSFPIDLLQRIDYVLDQAPKDAVCLFFVATNRAMLTGYKFKKNVLKNGDRWWSQVGLYPVAMLKDFDNIIDDLYDKGKDDFKSDDGRLMQYFRFKKIIPYTILPSFTQHIGAFRSTLRHNGKAGRYYRNTFCFDTDFDVKSVDWKKEFENA